MREKGSVREKRGTWANCVCVTSRARQMDANGRAVRWARVTRRRLDERGDATAPAEVIIGAPSYVGTHASLVRNNGCNSSHVFFF